MAKKLTPAMEDLLLAMRRGVRLHFMNYSGSYAAYYFRSDTMKSCTKQADGLFARGLIFTPDQKYNRLPWELNEAGKSLADELLKRKGRVR